MCELETSRNLLSTNNSVSTDVSTGVFNEWKAGWGGAFEPLKPAECSSTGIDGQWIQSAQRFSGPVVAAIALFADPGADGAGRHCP